MCIVCGRAADAWQRRRPPLEMTLAPQAFAKQASAFRRDWQNAGDRRRGRRAARRAFAALKTKAPVIERFGLGGLAPIGTMPKT